jgi:hypothetical protein
MKQDLARSQTGNLRIECLIEIEFFEHFKVGWNDSCHNNSMVTMTAVYAIPPINEIVDETIH